MKKFIMILLAACVLVTFSSCADRALEKEQGTTIAESPNEKTDSSQVTIDYQPAFTTDSDYVPAPDINPPLGPYAEEGGNLNDYPSVVYVGGVYYVGYAMPQTEEEINSALENAQLVGEPKVIGWGEGFVPKNDLESTVLYPDGTLIYQKGEELVAVFPKAMDAWGRYVYYGQLLKPCDSEYLSTYGLD